MTDSKGQAVHQHHSHAGNGRRAAGQLGPSRHADGVGAGRLLPVAAFPALRSGPSDLAQPRPLRVVGGPRFHAALFDAALDRRESGQRQVRNAGTAVRDARRHQAFSPARQQMPRPSGIPLDIGRRDHHRAARPGRGHERRHGHRASAGWQATSIARASSCSITTSTPCAATAA